MGATSPNYSFTARLVLVELGAADSCLPGLLQCIDDYWSDSSPAHPRAPSLLLHEWLPNLCLPPKNLKFHSRFELVKCPVKLHRLELVYFLATL